MLSWLILATKEDRTAPGPQAWFSAVNLIQPGASIREPQISRRPPWGSAGTRLRVVCRLGSTPEPFWSNSWELSPRQRLAWISTAQAVRGRDGV